LTTYADDCALTSASEVFNPDKRLERRIGRLGGAVEPSGFPLVNATNRDTIIHYYPTAAFSNFLFQPTPN